MLKIKCVGWMLNVVIAFLVLIGIVIVFTRVSILAQPVPPIGDFYTGYAKHVGLTLLHILLGLIFIILGPLQFSTRIRKKHSAFHRWSGRVYVIVGALTAVSGLILSYLNAFAGLNGAAAITFFSTLFLISLTLAVYRIRRREIAAHREWMIRAFAIGLAITSTRPIFVTLSALTGKPDPEVLGVTFWIAFSLHVVIAEIWINVTRAKPSVQNVSQK